MYLLVQIFFKHYLLSSVNALFSFLLHISLLTFYFQSWSINYYIFFSCCLAFPFSVHLYFTIFLTYFDSSDKIQTAFPSKEIFIVAQRKIPLNGHELYLVCSLFWEHSTELAFITLGIQISYPFKIGCPSKQWYNVPTYSFA